MTAGSSTVEIDGKRITLHSVGGIHHYSADGVLTMDHRQAPYSAAVDGHSYELSYTAPILTTYVVIGGNRILYTNRRSTGQQIYKRDGRIRFRDPIHETGGTAPETFLCQGGEKRHAGEDYSNEFVRLDADPTPPA